MKIFEKREYTDGGIHDKGKVIGYIKSDKTREELLLEQGHGFIDYLEISEEEYQKEKEKAEKKLKMFNL